MKWDIISVLEGHDWRCDMSGTSRFRIIALILLIIWCNWPGFSIKLASFPNLVEPEILSIRNDRIFISQRATVFIYSLKDFKLINKFGKIGEGPQEFKINPPDWPLKIRVLPEYIFVFSIGKISFFNLDGDFIKERKIPSVFSLQPIDGKFAGEFQIQEDRTNYRTINLYDEDMNKISEVCRHEHVFQGHSRNVEILKKNFLYEVCRDRIFVSAREEFVIDIYNDSGKLIRTIKREYERPRVTEADQQEVHQVFRREYGPMYQTFKQLVKIADYYPAIWSIMADDNNLYVLTYKRANGKYEFFIYDLEGNFKNTVFLPMIKLDPFRPFPLCFSDQRIFQIVEDEDTEVWELHMNHVNLKK